MSGIAVAEFAGHPIGALGVGSIVGEIALLDNTRRTASVSTMTATQVLVLSKLEFDELLYIAPTAEADITRIAAERLAVLSITRSTDS